jgi:hypothetical protein
MYFGLFCFNKYYFYYMYLETNDIKLIHKREEIKSINFLLFSFFLFLRKKLITNANYLKTKYIYIYI